MMYLSVLGQNARGNLRVLLDKLEDRVGEDIGAGSGKVHQGLEARIRLAEDTVTVAGNDTARLESIPEVSADIFVGELGSDLVLHLLDPAENLLSSETMQGASETQETGTVAQEGIAESAANQVGSVGGYVTTLVITVQSQVQTEQVVEVLVLLAALAEQLGEVVRPILGEIQLLGAHGINLVGTENQSSDAGDLCQKRNAVVKGRLPVLGLVQTLLIGLGELGLGVERGNRN
jgi:hypothetical protein